MYLSVGNLTADFCANVSIESIADYFSLPLDIDEELKVGIYISKPVSFIFDTVSWK